jgi:hypothetical protein
MDLEDILLSEISQTQRNTLHGLAYTWNLKTKTQIHRNAGQKVIIRAGMKSMAAGIWGQRLHSHSNVS